MKINFSLDLSISFHSCLRTINTLRDTDAACDVIALALCLRMYGSPLHRMKVQRKTTTHTPTTHESYRVEEAKIAQTYLLLEGPLLYE